MALSIFPATGSQANYSTISNDVTKWKITGGEKDS